MVSNAPSLKNRCSDSRHTGLVPLTVETGSIRSAGSVVRQQVTAHLLAPCELDPDVAGAPLLMEPDDAGERWQDHPLSQSTEILRAVLGSLLYDSLPKLLALPDTTLVYPAHGAGSLCGKAIGKESFTTIGEQ